MTAVSDPIDYNPKAAAASASAAVISDLSSPSKTKKERGLVELQPLAKRTACAKQPDGYGPKPSVDTVDAFLSFDTFSVRSTHFANQFPANAGAVYRQQCPNSPGLHKVLCEPEGIRQRQYLLGLDHFQDLRHYQVPAAL